MTVSPELLQEAAAEQQAPSEGGLAAVADLVSQQMATEDEIAQLEAALKEASGLLRRISELDLPNAMMEHNLTGWTAADGSSVAIKDIVRASISKANQAEAFAWLQANGYADLIKNQITVSFGRGEDATAHTAFDAMAEQGFEPTQKRSVHSGTLSAQAKAWIADGVDFPADALGVYQGQKTQITRKK